MSHLASVQLSDKNHASQRHALRSRRTRELLLDHMYRLALEKGYEGITVQQLLDSTGVARSTFYAHFRDKEDLIVAGYEAHRHTFDQGDRGRWRPPRPAGCFSLAVQRH